MTQPAAPSSSEMAESKQWKYNLDPDILECPICSVPFSPPVYQCENGHTVCSACREKITKGCPSCTQPLGRIRNIAIEKIIASLQVECKHRGCNTVVKYTERKEHKNELCEYFPIRCPVPIPYQCQHIGPKIAMPLHLREQHKLMEVLECSGSRSSVSFKMKASGFRLKALITNKAWLLVHCFSNDQSYPYLYCTACGTSKEVTYKLTVEVLMLNTKTASRLHVYSMQAVAKNHLQVDDWKNGFLVIPHKAVESNVTLSVLHM